MNDNSVDIIIKDAIGTFSASADRATVTDLRVRDPFIEILVSYPQRPKELYSFDTKERRLAWSQHKFGVAVDKSHTFISDCN